MPLFFGQLSTFVLIKMIETSQAPVLFAIFSLSALSNIFLIRRLCSSSARPLLRPRKLILCLFKRAEDVTQDPATGGIMQNWQQIHRRQWCSLCDHCRGLVRPKIYIQTEKQQIQWKWKIIQTKCSGREHYIAQ